MKIRKKYPLSNLIFIFFLSLMCLFYFIYFHNLVPPKFSWDSVTIMSSIRDPNSMDTSYKSAAIFFKLLGITSSNIYLHLIAWLIFVLLLLFILRINKDKEFSTMQMFFISFFAFMYGIYFNTLSKDLILIFFLLIFTNLYINNNNFNYLILFLILYSIFFRNYWIILFIFSLFIYIIKKPNLRQMMKYIIFIFIIIIIVYDLLNKDFITNQRMKVNILRLGDTTNARSMIQNMLPNTNIINDCINYIYVLITLLIPIQGISSLNMIVYYIWIIILIILIVKYRNNLNKKILLLLFVYINMQALFEPDLGSAFRHQLALYPLIYYLLNTVTIKEKK